MTMLQPFASASDFTGFASNAELLQNTNIWTPAALASLMIRASRSIESRCDRRLAPFVGFTQSFRAEGVAIDGSPNDDIPLDLRGALGRSQSMAYGATSLVRDVWLAEYAPLYPDLWTYAVTQIQIVTTYGATETLDPGQVEGPEPDTGHMRLRLGTFCPPGTTIRVTYSGGYPSPPDDLVLATIFQATKFLLLGAEPEMQKGMDTVDLDAEIVSLTSPYVRY